MQKISLSVAPYGVTLTITHDPSHESYVQLNRDDVVALYRALHDIIANQGAPTHASC